MFLKCSLAPLNIYIKSVPEIPQATEAQITEDQTEALKALKEDLDVAKNRIRDLEEERDDLTSQLVSSKQKQLNLINEVGGIKEARPEAEDYQALKTAKDALEKKFVEVPILFSNFFRTFFRKLFLKFFFENFLNFFF